MFLWRIPALYLFGVLPLVLSALALTGAPSAPWPPRRFEFVYRFTVVPPAEAQRLQIWVPLAASNQDQEASLWRAEGPIQWTQTTEPVYGNALLYGELLNPSKGPLEVALHFRVARQEAGSVTDAEGEVSRYLEPDRLVPLDDRFQQMALAIAREKTAVRDQARAIYDFVLGYMAYDKSGTGWGRGDAVYACDVRRGNCTDFHSLFIALVRSVGIPARFVIGFPLPADRRQGLVEGYHCWAEFFVPDEGWVPVDISEAWKQPARQDYFFGTLDRNRVEFTKGRDLALSPPQRGEPLNYFIYPYAEADGSPLADLAYRFEFQDGTPPRGQ